MGILLCPDCREDDWAYCISYSVERYYTSYGELQLSSSCSSLEETPEEGSNYDKQYNDYLISSGKYWYNHYESHSEELLDEKVTYKEVTSIFCNNCGYELDDPEDTTELAEQHEI